MNVPAAKDNSSSSTVPIDKQRLTELSHEELVKLYGRGYKLLLKAGFTAESAKTAPIKVHVRKPREGLKDDDTIGRRVLGDNPTTRAVPGISANDIDEYLVLYPRIKSYVESAGGSCSVKALFHKVVRPLMPRANCAVFNLVVSVDNKFFTCKSGTVFLKKAPISMSCAIECACCHHPFVSIHAWSWHVLRTLDQMHGQYEQELLNVTAKAPGLATYTCLACIPQRQCDYPNLLRLLHHCRTMNNDAHDQFGLALVSVFLAATKKQQDMMDALFLSAIEDGDAAFPYKEISAVAFESIPFEPGTPIDVSSDDEVAEIVDVESDVGLINLED